jgi:hypothetical protein
MSFWIGGERGKYSQRGEWKRRGGEKDAQRKRGRQGSDIIVGVASGLEETVGRCSVSREGATFHPIM